MVVNVITLCRILKVFRLRRIRDFRLYLQSLLVSIMVEPWTFLLRDLVDRLVRDNGFDFLLYVFVIRWILELLMIAFCVLFDCWESRI